MTQVVVAQRMWQRRGIAAEWTAKNPILEAGEIGVELGASPADAQKFKIGNGITPWNTLDYAGGGEGASIWRDGEAAPSNTLGVEGDYYLHTTTGDVYRRGPTTYAIVANIKGPPGPAVPGLPGDPGVPGPPGPSSTTFPGCSFNGGAGAIKVGAMAQVYVPFGFEITGWALAGEPLGNIVIDVRSALYGAYPPQASDSMCGSSPPALLGTNKARETDLSDWPSTIIEPGSYLRFYVTACQGVTIANLDLQGVRN